MRKRRKILGVVLALIICICNVGTVVAAETNDIIYEELSPTPPAISNNIPGNISVYDLTPPSSSNIYENNTQNYVYGNTQGYELYTNSCFYGVSKITGSIVNESSGKVKISLWRYWGNFYVKTSKSAEISADSKGAFSFEGLDAGTFYYLKFEPVGELDFHGFVGGVTG